MKTNMSYLIECTKTLHSNVLLHYFFLHMYICMYIAPLYNIYKLYSYMYVKHLLQTYSHLGTIANLYEIHIFRQTDRYAALQEWWVT